MFGCPVLPLEMTLARSQAVPSAEAPSEPKSPAIRSRKPRRVKAVDVARDSLPLSGDPTFQY